jgi:hypothetical protein
LRALATGLPATVEPEPQDRQDLQCAITAKTNLQYLIVNASNGVRSTATAPARTGGQQRPPDHPPRRSRWEKVTLTINGQSYGAAPPWADPSVTNATAANTGQLSSAVLARTSFFHYVRGRPCTATSQGDEAAGGGHRRREVVSSYAAPAACFGTVQAAPIAVGARQRERSWSASAGRMLPRSRRTQLAVPLTGARGDADGEGRAARPRDRRSAS